MSLILFYFLLKNDITDEAKAKIQSELISSGDELQLRIETYNHQIKNIDKDLKNLQS